MVKYSLMSKQGSFEMIASENYVSFGNISNLQETFFIHLSYFHQFFDAVKNILLTFPQKDLKKQSIFINDETKCMYLWETLNIFDDFTQQYYLAIKFVMENNRTELVYNLTLDKNQFFCLLQAFFHSIFLTLPLENYHKLWLKHCSCLQHELLRKNYLLLNYEAQKFVIDVKIQPDTMILIELFNYYYLIIKMYSELRDLLEPLTDKFLN